jgi:hypothetical protein
MNRTAQRDDGFRGPIHKHSDGFDVFRQLRNNLPGRGWCDDARTFLVKIESQGGGSQIAGRFGISGVGDATNFYADHCT